MRRTAIFLGLLVLLVTACSKPDATSSGVASSASAPQVNEPSDLAETKDAIETLRALWPLSSEANKASGDWADCHDQTVGVAAISKCLEEAQKHAANAKHLLPAPPVAKLACGKEIESAHRAYLDQTVASFAKAAGWFEANKAKLARGLAKQSIFKVCEPLETEACAASYLDSSYTTISGVKCTKRLLLSGGDAPCDVQCVARLLGLGDSDGNNKTPGPWSLTVRSTGEVIKPGTGSR